MAGVINIITKEAEDVDGFQITGRGGSFDTWEGNALFGKKFGELEVAGYVDYRNTQGFRGHVEEDQQSLLDRRYGTHASLAPGSMKGDLYEWDAQLTLKYGGLKFDGKYIDRNRDLPFGMSREVLDNASKWDNRDYYLNLSYDATITEGLDLMVKAYRNQHTFELHNQRFGRGTLLMTPTGPTITSVDRFSESSNKSSRMGAEAQVTYEIVDSNTPCPGSISLWSYGTRSDPQIPQMTQIGNNEKVRCGEDEKLLGRCLRVFRGNLVFRQRGDIRHDRIQQP